MSQVTQYGKPCMTNLPYELGKRIFEQIDNAPPPIDEETRKREVERLIKEITLAREKY